MRFWRACEIPNTGDHIVLGIRAPNLRQEEKKKIKYVRNSLSKLQKKERTFPRFQTTNKPKCGFWKEKKIKWTRLEKSLWRNLQSANGRNLQNQCGGLNQNRPKPVLSSICHLWKDLLYLQETEGRM